MRQRVTGIGRRAMMASIVAAIGMALPSLSSAQELIIDTGPGGNFGGLSLTGDQFLAGQFTLDEPANVTGLEGWMIYPTVVGDLPVEAVLYGNLVGGPGVPDAPDLLDEIRRQQFLVPASLTTDWHGIEGFVIPLEAGTYWLAFEPPTSSFGSGAMPPTPLQELDLYAVDTGTGYVSNTTARIGIRVLPEPAMATGMWIASLALAVAGRRHRESVGHPAEH